DQTRTFNETANASSSNLAMSSGSGQSASAGTTLASPFTVTVTDANGIAISGASVNWNIVSTPSGSTGERLSNSTSTTDASGRASTTLTLGSVSGTYQVQASMVGMSGSPVTFIATATSSSTNIATLSGSGQSGAMST